MKAYFLTVLLFGLAACCNKSEQNPDALVKGIDSNVASVASKDIIPGNHNVSLDKDTVPKNIQIDTVIHLAFGKDSMHLEVKATLNKESLPVICYFPVDRKRKLMARLISDNKNLNVRFSRVIAPDNSSDGPFERQLKYDLVQKGVYKFIIGPNLMADGLRSGDFWIKLEVKDMK